jgi:hypothetical protein
VGFAETEPTAACALPARHVETARIGQVVMTDDRRRCPRCGENRPKATTRHGLCQGCATGIKTHRHHPWFRASFPQLKGTIRVPTNDHAVLTALWQERCEALKYPGTDPLHRGAAMVATIGEGCEAFADIARRKGWPPWVADLASLFARTAGSLAHWLLCLAGELEARHGPDWAIQLGMPEINPEEEPQQ